MKLSDIWARAGTLLVYDSLDYNCSDEPTYPPGGDEDAPGHVPRFSVEVRPGRERTHADYDQSDHREFTAIVRGRLPRDFIDIRAYLVKENGTRETAFVKPEFISPHNYYDRATLWDDVQKQEDFVAFRIWQLNPIGDRALPRVSPGRYQVSLCRNGKELCSSNLTISK